MSKRVVFHVGLPKTGTTTIQHYLRSQDEKLQSFGILYPGSREHEAMESHKHDPMLNALGPTSTAAGYRAGAASGVAGPLTRQPVKDQNGRRPHL